MNRLRWLAIAAFAITAFEGVSIKNAEAKSCYYYAHTPDGGVFASGDGFHKKESVACRRARRECNRQLGWKVIRHGKPSGLRPCTRLQLGHDPVPEPGPPKRTNGGPSKPRPDTTKPPN